MSDKISNMNKAVNSLGLSNLKVLRVLLCVVSSLLLIHLILQWLHYYTSLPVPDTLIGRFDVDNEISIPTWWSQTVLLISAGLGVAAWKVGGSRWWLAFSGLFLFLSVDEGAMLHEAFITKFREYTTNSSATGLGAHTWLIPVTIVFVILLIPFVKFIHTLPKRSVVLLATGMGLLFFGAIVYETIGLLSFEAGTFWYQGLNVAIEEAFEMFGASLVVYAVLEEIRRMSPRTSVVLGK